MKATGYDVSTNDEDNDRYVITSIQFPRDGVRRIHNILGCSYSEEQQ